MYASTKIGGRSVTDLPPMGVTLTSAYGLRVMGQRHACRGFIDFASIVVGVIWGRVIV